MRNSKLRTRTDRENQVVSSDSVFRALIERSRRRYPTGSGLTTADVRRKLQAGRRKVRRSSLAAHPQEIDEVIRRNEDA